MLKRTKLAGIRGPQLRAVAALVAAQGASA
jgi:hypothetical protein